MSFLFGKKRYGDIIEVEQGRQWRWELADFKKRRAGKTMDSENMVSFRGVEFHFHMVIGSESNPDHIGFYIHYKGTPVPKYTYAVGSSSGLVVRQHTAYSIPPDCERCGHGAIATLAAAHSAIDNAGDGKLVVWFQFDHDLLERTGNPGEFAWTIPKFKKLRIGPFYSSSFVVEKSQGCLKLSVNPKSRDEITISISSKNASQLPSFWIRLTNLEGAILYETDKEVKAPNWPSFKYAPLLDHLGKEGALIVYCRFTHRGGDAADTAWATIGAPPPGVKTHKDEHGTFAVMDDHDDAHTTEGM